MNRPTHPIAALALGALRRDEAGRPGLDPRAAGPLHDALDAAAASGGLRPALTALVEVAYVVERDTGATETADALRAIAAAHTAPLVTENTRREAGEQRRMARFRRFSGQPEPTRPAPIGPPPKGGLRVADLRPARPILAR